VTLPELVTRLVQTAPARDRATVSALLDGLRAHGSRLALAIARIVELVDEELVDPGIALPALAEAIDALVDPRADRASLDAAKYRIDTLEPRPDPPARIVVPDVTLAALVSRGRPPRT
jgi:hypothetical protein